jgi:hypothetical protein
MASRKRKKIGFRTEKELADAVNEIVNYSDSEAENIPEFSSSEESESESAVQSGKPKLELYWSTRGIFRTPVFSQTMSRNRFQLKSSRSSTPYESEGSSRTPTPTPPKRAPKNDPPGRLDGKLNNHKLVHIPPTKKDKTPTRKCRVCVRKNIKKETRFLCVQCGVPLHPEGCYTRYHTLKHY